MPFDWNFAAILISGVFVAAAGGLVGSFLIIRRMVLMADTFAHVALPGIALGVVLHFTPIWGGLLTLFAGALLIWFVETKTKLATESATGVIFVASLAIAALAIPQTDLLEAFFGNIQNISLAQLALQTAVAIGVIIFVLKYVKQLTLFSIAPDLSASLKVSPLKMQLVLLILIALTIAIGISFAGAFLMSSILIIPAATARNLSSTFNHFMAGSVFFSIIALATGLPLSGVFKVDPGLTTALVSVGLFVGSLVAKR